MEYDFWKFANEHYFVFFLLVLVVIIQLGCLVESIFFRLPNRFLRCLNIRKHGWPPEHCDADGDFKPESKSQDSSDE